MTPFQQKKLPALKLGALKIRVLIMAFLLSWAAWPASAAEDEAEEESGEVQKSVYVEMQPAFVTNYGGADRLRYMKVEVTLRVLGERGQAQVNHHMPAIKDTLLSLFAVQTGATIGSAEGKEKLRQQALTAVGKVLEEEDKTSQLTDLLFTSFVAHS